MPEVISTNHRQRHVRIHTNHSYGSIEELHASIDAKHIHLTRMNSEAKPRKFVISSEDFVISSEDLDALVLARYEFQQWLKMREKILAEAETLCQSKLPGSVHFFSYDSAEDEEYTIATRSGWDDTKFHDREVIWEHVALEDLVEQIKDAIERVAERQMPAHLAELGVE